MTVVDEEQTSVEMRKPEDASDRAPQRARVRTCVGCGEREDAARGHDVLVRLVLGPGGAVTVDAGRGTSGRGAHVHPRPGCIAGAVSRGLPRAAKNQVHLGHDGAACGPLPPHAPPRASRKDDDEAFGRVASSAAPAPLRAEELAGAMVVALDRRIAGLLLAAGRARALALGAEAVRAAFGLGEAHLVVVPCDASAAVDLGEVRRAIAAGGAVAWGTRASLAEVLRPTAQAQGVGVVAVKRDAIARELKAAVHARDACASTPPGSRRGGGGRERGRRRTPPSGAGSSGSVSRAEVATAATPGRSLAERGA